MFCCTRPGHEGELIVSCCQHQECIHNNSQLCCMTCIKQFHSEHTQKIQSIKKIMPDLLKANSEKNEYLKILEGFVTFLDEEFGDDALIKAILGNNKIIPQNATEIAKLMLMEMKKNNKQQGKKIKDIEKTLKVHNQIRQNSPTKSSISNFTSVNFKSRDEFDKNIKNYETVPLSTSMIASIQTFSQFLKHPYISVSNDGRFATKSAKAGSYKLAVLSASPIPADAESTFFNLKIVKSSGNILLGLGLADIIKEKEYLNCYGAGQGTFLIGQNGNDPSSSIIFHHSDGMYNRKQNVGWNFKEGDIISIGLIQQNNNQFVSFRQYSRKGDGQLDFRKINKQFTMPLWERQNKPNKLHVVAILQNFSDQIQFIPTQE